MAVEKQDNRRCSVVKNVLRAVCYGFLLLSSGLNGFSSEPQRTELDQVIHEVYRKELGRSPDKEGLRHYRQLMETEGRDRSWLSNVLSNSKEGLRYRSGKRMRFLTYTSVFVWLLIAVSVGVCFGSSSPIHPLRTWRWWLLAAFFLRGLAVLCITPPLEGIDEYQHIAVLQFRLEHRRVPIYGQDIVPESLRPHLKAYPHPGYSWVQLKAQGVRRYRQYYTLEPGPETQAMPMLYQAQHPTLYYWLTAPLFGFVSRIGGIVHATYTLRLLNLLLGFGGLLLLLTPMFQIWKDQRIHLLITLVAGMSPMFLPYIARVANDPLALFFSGLVVHSLFRTTNDSHPLRNGLATGICIGLAVLSKLIGLVLLPAGILYLTYCLIVSSTPMRGTLIRMGSLILGFSLVALPFVIWSLNTYHVPFPAQETINNAAAGYGFSDLLAQIHPHQLVSFLYQRMLVGNLWTSGWSFLKPNPTWTLLVNVLLFSGIGVGCVGWGKRFFHDQRVPSSAWVFCMLLSAGALAAAYVHALNSLLSWGDIVTPSHYIMIALPAFTILLAACTDGASRRVTVFLLVAFWGILPAVELQSLLFRAVPYWSQVPLGYSALQRLSDLTPGWLPWWGFPAGYLLSLLLQASVLFRVFAQEHSK